MGEERFISWRKEHLEKIKEQEEEEKKVEVAEIFAVVIQSSEEEVNSKPRTVLLQGVKGDMNICKTTMPAAYMVADVVVVEEDKDDTADVTVHVNGVHVARVLLKSWPKYQGVLSYLHASGNQTGGMHASGSSQKSIRVDATMFYTTYTYMCMSLFQI